MLSRNDTVNPKVYILDKPCSGSQGQQRGNTSAFLLAKLGDDVNRYLRNLGDTFNDWGVTLVREDWSKPHDLHEDISIPNKRVLPQPYSEMSSDNSTDSSVTTPCNYIPLCASKPTVNYHSPKSSPIPCNDFPPVHISTCLVGIPQYKADKIRGGDQTRVATTPFNGCDSNFSQCPSDVNHSKIKAKHCDPHIHLNHASDVYRSTGKPTSPNYMTIPKMIPDAHTKAEVNNITAQYSKGFAKFLAILEQEEKKNLAREKLLESEKEDLESWRLALKYKSKISQLTLDKLLEKNNGWAYLLSWIDEVETNCMDDSVRLYMLKLTTEKPLLRMLKLRPEQTKSSKVVTWGEAKKRLMSLITKEGLHKTTFKLLKENMEQDSNPRVFMARIMEKYSEVCDLYGVQALPVSLNQVIACTVTANMNLAARELYYNDLRDNAQRATKEMEKSFQDENFRRSLFNPTTSNSQSEEPAAAISFAAEGQSFNNHCEGQDKYPKFSKEFWKTRVYRRAKCWWFQRGTCKFAMLPGGCRYEHK